MKCCIMLSSKYSLNCCTCLIWLEFKTWFEFELKTLKKINRKCIRKSLEIEKLISAQSAQQAQPRAPSVPNRRVPPVDASPRAPSLPLSLPLPSGPALSAPFLSHARPLLSLSHRAHLSIRPQPRDHVPCRGRAHDTCSPATSARPRPF
jgi:hypothetical protein